jgi:hypothetical protein
MHRRLSKGVDQSLINQRESIVIVFIKYQNQSMAAGVECLLSITFLPQRWAATSPTAKCPAQPPGVMAQ